MKNEIVKIEMTISEANKNELQNIRFCDGPKNQQLLKTIIDEGRRTRSEDTDDYLLSLIERFASRGFCHVYEQRSWREFVIDVLIDELRVGLDPMDIEMYMFNAEEFSFIVDVVMEGYRVDGSYTYNTFRSRELIFDFAEDLAEYSEGLSAAGIDSLRDSEQFLLSCMIEEMYSLIDGDTFAEFKEANDLYDYLESLK